MSSYNRYPRDRYSSYKPVRHPVRDFFAAVGLIIAALLVVLFDVLLWLAGLAIVAGILWVLFMLVTTGRF